jgi:hypothetical protein
VALFSDRKDNVTAARDENADGVVNERDDRIVADRTSRDDFFSRDPAREDQPVAGRSQHDEREISSHRATATATPPVDATDADVVVAGPRPRASFLATLSLIIGVAAVLAVLTGALAGPGVALGVVAALLGLVGVSATNRRHVAGKTDALIGFALGAAAVVVGLLALTGNLGWLSPDTENVTAVRDWLDARLPWLFPD